MDLIEDLFWERVDKAGPVPQHCPNLGPCWLWVLAPSSSGYGNFKFGQKQYATHRLAWTIQVGPIPAGLFVLHHCDQRLCVRDTHLFLGTQKENMQDMDAKKRRVNPTGEQHGQAKFTDEQIRRAKEFVHSGMSQREAAARSGISQSHLSKILSGNDRSV